MVEKKCKICGEWYSSRKIAMHYWNIHKKKYKEYKDGEEQREIVEAAVEPEKINKEEYVLKENTIGLKNDEQEGEVINEIFRPINKVEKHTILDDGEVINEWC